MAALSFRDRLLTRRGARAIMSPVGIVGGVAAAAIAAVAGLPVWAAALVGVGLWAGNVLRLLLRGPRAERVDPFTLQEPWRRFVQSALQSRARFDEAVGHAPAGPLRDHLGEIAARMQSAVDECWQVAKRGQALVRARRGIDLADVDRQLAELDTGTGADDPAVTSVVQALQAQRATAERLGVVIERTQRELRVLDARLDEAVARGLELSAHASADVGAGAGSGLTGLDSDVDGVVSEMEALRQALDEATTAAQGGALPGELPPGGRA
jgi:hypothetical protein